MREIRPFQASDSEELASLYLKCMRGIPNAASARLAEYFVHVFINHPWPVQGIESLICVQDGRIAGFMGIIPRPMLLQGQLIQVAVLTQFFVDRSLNNGLLAFEIFRRALAGAQDLSYTDGSAEGSALIWESFGGEAARLYSFNWLRTFRPLSTLQEHSIGRRPNGIWNPINKVYSVLVRPVDSLLQLAGKSALRPEAPFVVRTVGEDELFGVIEKIGWREKLKPNYTLESFRWLMSESRKAQFGELRMRVTLDQEKRPNGWFIYYFQKNGVCTLQQLGAQRNADYQKVLASLFSEAAASGGSCIKGQSQPRRLVALTAEHCLFRHPMQSVMFHTRNKEISDAIHRGDAALSRLDGECWLRFPVEKWA